MSGRPKPGIDYAGWSVNIFDGDTKIDKLLDAQGWIGFSIYFYLCQMAYKFDGYFYRWSYDDSATTARRMGGGIGSETVKQAVGLCLQIGLFDKRLFDRDGILTSRGIQRRFYAAIQGRRVKSVIAEYWLLGNEESKGLEKCALYSNLPPENNHLQPANAHLQPANAYKSKVKESKVKDTPPTPPEGGWGFGDELEQAVADWLNYQKERRHPCVETGVKSLIDQIRKMSALHGEAAISNLIRECMASNWQGIIWDKLPSANTGTQAPPGDTAWMRKYIQGRDKGG